MSFTLHRNLRTNMHRMQLLGYLASLFGLTGQFLIHFLFIRLSKDTVYGGGGGGGVIN